MRTDGTICRFEQADTIAVFFNRNIHITLEIKNILPVNLRDTIRPF
jgi:hypothetical protein